MAFATSLALFFFFFFFFFPICSLSQSDHFVYNGFNESNIPTLEGASILKPSGVIKLTNASYNLIGHAFYQYPIKMKNTSSSSSNASSFSTQFVFAIRSPISDKAGFGLAFTMSPSPGFPGADAGHFLGIFNSSNDNNTNNHIFAVEFDTVKGYKEEFDSEGNHVGINVNSVYSIASHPAVDYSKESRSRDLQMDSGDPIHVWVDYDGTDQILNVTISPIKVEKPTKPLISEEIDLSSVLQETMYVGFSASTGNSQSSFHYILAWSFAVNGIARDLNHSQLPSLPEVQVPSPPKDKSSSYKPQIKALLVALAVVVFLLMAILFFFTLYRRMMPIETLEDWEIDCPHRFKYKDLHAAAKGFRSSDVIGSGGFGSVYKGVLPSTGCEVAIKRITSNGIQGMREFAAEIESLGRLRHKNLVNLQGWCKKKNDLLIVYDYIPNGNLSALIFDPKDNFVLSWEQRFNILKGIASGLLYLHEEWEQIVIHRDVKSSNVLIDADMNARLGDFGLARLYDHGEVSHTTGVVGTIGYIAPELARTGKASTRSDVFAYGVLLLEVASGRRPIGPGHSDQFILVDWVMENHQTDRLLDAVDTRLGSDYAVKEMELVLRLGLLCSHFKPEARPTMRQVVRYLNEDEPLPPVYNWELVESDRISEMNSRFLSIISSDNSYKENQSSSFTDISSSSTRSGR